MTTTWKCEVCGYIHTGPEPPATCPVCGVSGELFGAMEAVTTSPASEGLSAPPQASAWRCSICEFVHQGDGPPDECPVCGAAWSLFDPEEQDEVVSGATNGRRIVIVGAGVAGITAAEHARRAAPEASITVVSREPGLPYYRLNLTRFLAGEVSEEELTMQGTRWFDEHRISLVTAEVKAIDRGAKEIQLADAAPLPYDAVVLANGAHAFVPPFPGATRQGVFVMRTKDDVAGIKELVGAGTRAVVIGGGLLGLEAAGALRTVGLEVAVVEGFDWLLPRQLPPAAGRMLQSYVEGLGIEVKTGARVEELAGDEEVRAVRLSGGVELPTDVVVVSTGIRPNSYLARQAGLEVHHGIVVDDTMTTSDPKVLAAGDVAEHRGRVYGIWPASYAEGQVAGINAAGGAASFKGLAPSNRLKVLDVDVFSIGDITVDDASYHVEEVATADTYRGVVCRDGVVVGAALYGDTSMANVVKDAVESGDQIALSPALLELFPGLAAKL